MTLEKYSIKPSASIIATIGSEIIKDPFAAIIELVKNSYDADAENVHIKFSQSIDNDNTKSLNISIDDDGHGMSPEIIKSAWLVPATKNKYKKKVSPSGRYFLGRKGIGRYASSILGNYFELTSIDKSHIKTTVKLNWSDFYNYDFLEEVPIFLEQSNCSSASGTSISIKNEPFDFYMWNETTFFKLIKELKLLVSPLDDVGVNSEKSKLPFNIFLTIDIPNNAHNCDFLKIEPFDLQDFYNYRLYGLISKDGFADLVYENACGDIIQSEPIQQIFPLPIDSSYSYCGDIYIDFRVFDRDAADIQNISEKSKTLFDNFYLGKLQTRQLLNEISGVKLYRNNFRIRPYGERNNDWLNLDKERVQKPAFKIGNNQIIGQVIIDTEEDSSLIESSSREGLKENSSYNGLISLLKDALTIVETRRYAYRKNSGKGRNRKNINDIINGLPNFLKLSENIGSVINSNDPSEEKANKVFNIITEVENKTRETIDELQNIIAMYQGQATLGKIVMIVLHEGRKPLQWLNTSSKRMKIFEQQLKSDRFDKKLVLNNIAKTLSDNAEYIKMVSKLFDKIEPLSVKSKRHKENFNINESIRKSINIFDESILKNNIKINFENKQCNFYGYPEDIITTFTNLLENSIYWLNYSTKETKEITINTYDNLNDIEIIYQDNGPGISKELLENQIIFEPDFSTKTDGTGIGLAICGEAISRNSGSIEANYSDDGALFRIKLTKEKK